VTAAGLRTVGGLLRRTSGATSWVVALGLAVGGFCLIVATIGASPREALRAMWDGTVTSDVGPGEVLVAATPILLS